MPVSLDADPQAARTAPPPPTLSSATLSAWTEEDLCDYLFYLTWICGVAVHVRYAAALAAHTTAAEALARPPESTPPFTEPVPLAQPTVEVPAAAAGPAAQPAHGEDSDARKAALRAGVQQRIFPRIEARVACVQKQASRVLALLAPPAASVSGLVRLASQGGSIVRREGTGHGASEVLAPAMDPSADATVFAAALQDAVLAEQRLGWRQGAGRTLAPAPPRNPKRQRQEAAPAVVVDAYVEETPSPTVKPTPPRRLEDYFMASSQGPNRARTSVGPQQSTASAESGAGVIVISESDDDERGT